MPSGRTARITFLVLGAVLLAAIVVTYYIVRTPPVVDQAEQLLFNSTLEDTFTDTAGAVVEIGEYAGEPLVVTTWASWCPQCTDELVLLDKVMAQRDSKITVLALNRNESLPQIERFRPTLPELPHVTFIVDTKDSFFAAALGYAMPETLVFNDGGEVVYHGRGISEESALRSALNSVEP